MNQNIEKGETSFNEDIREPLIHQKNGSPKKENEFNGSKEDRTMLYFSTFVAVCGSFAFGSCAGYSSPAQSQITQELNLSIAEYSLFGSILTFGAMIGAITSGPIADLVGRKGALRVSSVFCSVGWLAIYFAEGVLPLDIGRLATGYGMGVFSYVVPVFIAEIAPKDLRGALTTINQLMICAGVSVAFILGTTLSWRILAVTGLAPCVVLLLGLFIIPESPRWLARTGRKKEFEASLRKLRGASSDITEEAAEIKDYVETLETLPKAQLFDLFQRRYLLSVIVRVLYTFNFNPLEMSTMVYVNVYHGLLSLLGASLNVRIFAVGVGLMVFQQFGGINGIVFYLTSIFESSGVPADIGTITYAIIQVLITGLGAALIDKTGRKPLLVVSGSGLVLGCILTALSFYLKTYAIALSVVPILTVTGILVYVASFSIGMGAIPWVVMSEIFPIQIKGVAGSLATLVNWFGAWACSYTFNFLMTWSSWGTFTLYAIINALSILFMIKIVPETKGRTLEQIHAAMDSS